VNKKPGHPFDGPRFFFTLQATMDPILFSAPALLSLFILVAPSRIRYGYTVFITLLAIGVTSIPAILVFADPALQPEVITIGGFAGTLSFTIDSLSAFFILVTNFTAFTGLIYARGYLASYRSTKSSAVFALHYFSYCWLHLSMLGVLMLRDGMAFLIAWELMAVSSFLLILFEAEKRATLKTAVNYLVQMHVGLALLVAGFLIAEDGTGVFGFDSLPAWFSHHSNLLLFLLFFAGFAIKAGFIPFHTWLPHAHPAAPSHVSGVMSGVMIKMGIFGIIRVLVCVQSDLLTIGWVLLGISALSGLLGVMMAIVQHDLKKLLAYHSIENIGIIGMGLGLGAMGLGMHNPVLALLGFAGGLLHVLNHSLFKSLLFFSAGSVYRACHTLDIEKLGGLNRRMPHTAGLFLVGSMAICGLPPLNGFISEVLIYTGLFKGLNAGSAYQALTFILAVISLALIGGLAIFCFTKAFGVVFQGVARTDAVSAAKEATPGMLLPQYLAAGLMLAIGLLPMLFLEPILRLVSFLFHLDPGPELPVIAHTLSRISLAGFLLLLVTGVILLVRRAVSGPGKVMEGPTWGCGYTAGTPRHQYTASSWAAGFGELARPVLGGKTEYEQIGEEEIFPRRRSFAFHPADVFHDALDRITAFSMTVLKRIARLQTGYIQHYILYAFVFILFIFILLFLKIL